MRVSHCFLVAILFVALVAGDDTPKKRSRKIKKKIDGKIVGGSTVQISALPYMASLGTKESGHHCGATVIGKYTLITAAHCIDGMSASSLIIRTGATEVNKGGYVNAVTDIVMHPNYNKRTVDMDFAILHTAQPIQGAKMIRLASQLPPEGEQTLVSGWGLEAEDKETPSKFSRYVWVPMVNWEECKRTYARVNTLTKNMICAGYTQGGMDACQGDSGGPMVYNNELVGVVSWGKNCARAGQPGIYAYVGSARQWIHSLIF